MEFGEDMETRQSSAEIIELNDKAASDIALFCDIAESKGANLTLSQIIQLTSLGVDEAQLSRAWSNHEKLNAEFEIESGVVYKKGAADDPSSKLEFGERARRASSNVDFANRFGRYLANNNTLVLSISGSTSYQSVSRHDDLDFFCILKKDRVWIFLCRALLLARLFRSLDKKSPSICLSYVMDEDYARGEFTRPQDGLFARDALSTMVIHGESYYNALLKESAWMERYFRSMYASRTKHATEEVLPRSRKPSLVTRIVNYGLYLLAGNYIRVKSHLLNRRFAREGKTDRLFKLRMGSDHCIYESVNYLELRKKYEGLELSKQWKEIR